jgi:hypothetical protein
MKKNQSGFAIAEALLVLLVIVAIAAVGTFVAGQVGSKGKQTRDDLVVETLEKAKKEIGDKLGSDHALPDFKSYDYEVFYIARTNQKAEICATFSLPRNNKTDKLLSPVDLYRAYTKPSAASEHFVYRDDVDFAKHNVGRNCFVIDYAPINVAYEKQFEGKSYTWKVCDQLRGYSSRFTGQTIKGFFIGGSFTTNPGTAGGRAVLAQDADAYNDICQKIPISALKVGDVVEMYVEEGPKNGNEQTYFVKAIKKEQSTIRL